MKSLLEQFTRERLKALSKNILECHSATPLEIKLLSQIALAVMDAPVGPATIGGVFYPGDAVGVFNIGNDTCEDHLVAWTVKGQSLPKGVYWLYTAPPAASAPNYPEKLPCPVLLEPGLRFSKGVPTATMLGAIQRRAEYYAELDAMTPEERRQHEGALKDARAMLHNQRYQQK